MLIFKVYPGIGDISWVYSKCLDLTKNREIAFSICNDGPPRSSPFVDLLPGVTNLGYGDFSIGNGFGTPLPPDTDLSELPDGTYTVGVNPYLESGTRLDKIFPRQRTEYHYQLAIPESDKEIAQTVLMQGKTHPLIGFYASSYHHSAERGFWNYDEWALFLEKISVLYPSATFVAVGTSYDNKTQDTLQAIRQKGLTTIDAMNLDIGATIEVIRGLDYFFAFPSGLGILADVVETPCTMWFFTNFADAFINTYPDPANVASGKHINLLYHQVPEALSGFMARGMPWVRGIQSPTPIPCLSGQAGGKTTKLNSTLEAVSAPKPFLPTVQERDIREVLAQLPDVEPSDRSAHWFLSSDYYPVYQRVGRVVRPRRLLELGTRLGYSLIALMDGSGICEEVTWIDNESGLPDSNRRASNNIAHYLDVFSGQMVSYGCYLQIDALHQLNPVHYDLVHFDSDHSYTGTLFTLSLLRRLFPGAILLVDDFLAGKEVQAAVLKFAAESDMALVVQKTCQGLAILFDHQRRDLLGGLVSCTRPQT